MPAAKLTLTLSAILMGIAACTVREAGFRASLAPAPLVSQTSKDAAAKVCEVSSAMASFSIPYVSQPPELNTDPQSPAWSHASATSIIKDCTHQGDYPDLKTEVRGFFSGTDLYLLFICPYRQLNLWLPADNSKDRLNLWDRDVVEVFLGADWENIRVYREFEIAPTGDWVDLAIDLDRKSDGAAWNSGWQQRARIDEKAHIWYAAARVPLRSVTDTPVTAGTRWRVNLYRIDGLGPDSQRRFMCWQPTCVVNRDPNHVPEHFGTLIFTR